MVKQCDGNKKLLNSSSDIFFGGHLDLLCYLTKCLDTEAIDDFSKAIKINPIDPEGYKNLSAVYYLKGEYENAWNAINKASNFACGKINNLQASNL